MNQLSLFDLQEQRQDRVSWRLEVDGASRGNPGLSGAGIHVIKENVSFMKRGYFLGHRTNNQAEYEALILGVCMVRNSVAAEDYIEIVSDSELLVKQMTGVYTVKNDELKLLHARACELIAGMQVTLRHVVRELNRVADGLANQGIDKRIAVPEDLRVQCALMK